MVTLSDLSSCKSLAILLLAVMPQPDSITKITISLFPFINYQNKSSLSDYLHNDDPLDNCVENALAEKKEQNKSINM